MLWTGSGNGQRLQRTSCQSRGGEGEGEDAAASGVERASRHRELPQDPAAEESTNCATRKKRSVPFGARESPSSRNSATWVVRANLTKFIWFLCPCVLGKQMVLRASFDADVSL